MKPTAIETSKFEELCEIEPALKSIREDITAVPKTRNRPFCANALWYAPNGFRARMSQLVGWSAKNPALRSSEVYDLAYETLYALLPDCRDCGCFHQVRW